MIVKKEENATELTIDLLHFSVISVTLFFKRLNVRKV